MIYRWGEDMIKNLNNQTFQDYGAVLWDHMPNRGLPIGGEWILEKIARKRTPKSGYIVQKDGLYLDFEESMTVICVSINGGELEQFYFDKPVFLRAGVVFCLYSYSTDEVRARVSFKRENGRPEKIEMPTQLEPMKPMTSQLTVDHIFTLFYQKKSAGFIFKGESHPIYEFTYVDFGTLYNVVNGQTYVLNQGEAMIFGPDQWHMQYASKDCVVRFITISFGMDTKHGEKFLNRTFQMPAQGLKELKCILEEYKKQDAYSESFIINSLQNILLGLLRESKDNRIAVCDVESVSNENEIIDYALHYISLNINKKLTVTSVAHSINISPSYMTALFRKNLKISPAEYIRRLKLEESKRMIREGKMSFSQIAAALNYSSVHHFSQQFSSNTGMTPTQYAKKVRTN